jgi:hypothetical protein
MKSWVDTAAAALISGTAASLAMTAALALLAKKEGKGALQPINSTSHWLHGEQASSVRSLDVSHTIAALVDYGITPKRFTPGWEELLSKRSIGVTYAAMALGLTAGVMLTQG